MPASSPTRPSSARRSDTDSPSSSRQRSRSWTESRRDPNQPVGGRSMPQQQKQSQPVAEEVFKQTEDAHGRIRLDRPLSAREAQAQDRANRELYESEQRAKWQQRQPKR